MKVGQQVRSLDPRDSLGDLFTVEEVGVRHVSGPTLKLRRSDGESVYRLERLIRTNEEVSTEVRALLDKAAKQGE